MNFTFVVIDDNQESVLKTKALAESFQNLTFIGSAQNYDDGIDLILEYQPKLIFLEINPSTAESNLSFSFISELYRYLKIVPKIIITTSTKEYAFDALKYEVIDYLLKPLNVRDFRKAVFKLFRDIEINYTVVQPQVEQIKLVETNNTLESVTEENIEKVEDNFSEKTTETENIKEEEIATIDVNLIDEEENELLDEVDSVTEKHENELIENTEAILNTEVTESIDKVDNIEIEEDKEKNPSQEELIYSIQKPLVICVKSYGDYRYIDSEDILYFEADNNSTDIHLNNGEMITAFKTLKHFENVLPQNQFLRIHNSYIININQVSRIHTGNTVCYIKNSTTKLPFSKSYKDNVDLIIQKIAGGNYLEI